MLIAAEKDVLVTPSLTARAAEDYRVERRKLVAEGVLKSVVGQERDTNTRDAGEFIDTDVGLIDGVDYRIILKSGHHIQNDMQWEEAANVIYDWLKNL